MLIIALTVALLTMAALDALRMRVLVRAAMRFDRLLATRLLSAMVDRAAFIGHERGAQALRDFDQFRTIMAGPSIHFLFDAPWTPLLSRCLVSHSSATRLARDDGRRPFARPCNFQR